MITAGNVFGSSTSYGKYRIVFLKKHFSCSIHSCDTHAFHNFTMFFFFVGNALIKVGQGEQRIGTIEREFINNAEQYFTGPLRKFLEGEMKTISKERSILETKR